MPWREQVSIDEVLAFLNELVKVDEPAIRSLVETRVPCGLALAEHPTVQVQAYPNGTPLVGVLGVLNGLFGVDDRNYGPITAEFEDDGTLTGFHRTLHLPELP
jgi:hypothetical protein